MVICASGKIEGQPRATELPITTASGRGIPVGDGNLSYGLEKSVETYYDFQIRKALHGALDYQFISDPAFNRDRGPVSIFAARLHWSF